MTSDEGLDAYGAANWASSSSTKGSTPMPAGSTPPARWTWSTSSAKRFTQGWALFYRYGTTVRPVTAKTVEIAYKCLVFATMYTSVEALEQSFLRTKASDYKSFLKVAKLKANA